MTSKRRVASHSSRVLSPCHPNDVPRSFTCSHSRITHLHLFFSEQFGSHFVERDRFFSRYHEQSSRNTHGAHVKLGSLAERVAKGRKDDAWRYLKGNRIFPTTLSEVLCLYHDRLGPCWLLLHGIELPETIKGVVRPVEVTVVVLDQTRSPLEGLILSVSSSL